MYLTQLKLFQFRNFRSCCFEPDPLVNAIVGINGQGKTNLVEAISFLSFARSFRTHAMEELLLWGEKEASVFATVALGSGEQLEVGLTITKGSRKGYLNGKPVASLSSFVGKVLNVSFSPTDLSLVKGPASERRSYLDRYIVELQPQLLNVFIAYQKAHKNKSALLRNDSVAVAEIEPWNELLATYGSQIAQARLALLSDLSPIVQHIHHLIAGSNHTLDLSIEGVGRELLTVEDLRQHLAHYQEREIAAHKCLRGVHRDDLALYLNTKDARAYSSQGQARSIVLALKLGMVELIERRTLESPIVVLDDVESELDEHRQKALLEVVFERKRQVFITGTSVPSITGVKFNRVFTVKDGVIES